MLTLIAASLLWVNTMPYHGGEYESDHAFSGNIIESETIFRKRQFGWLWTFYKEQMVHRVTYDRDVQSIRVNNHEESHWFLTGLILNVIVTLVFLLATAMACEWAIRRYE